MKYSTFCLLIVGFCFLFSCKQSMPKDPLLQKALSLSGDNRSELEATLNHYSSPDDSLKYKAAVFLIKYMPNKYAKIFPEYEMYKPVFDTLEALNTAYDKRNSINYEFYKHYKRTVYNYFMAKHNIKAPKRLRFVIKSDLESITSDFLIENIDYAFKAWQMPWNKKLSFSDFCEFILPYRYGHEELKPWRRAYFESHKYLLDSLKSTTDPVKAALFVKKVGYKSISEMSELQGLSMGIRAADLIRINTTSTCQDETGAVMLRLRGLGIPYARITIPCWGNRGEGHDLN